MPALVTAADQGSTLGRFISSLFAPPTPHDGLKDGATYVVTGISRNAAGQAEVELFLPTADTGSTEGRSTSHGRIRVSLEALAAAQDQIIFASNSRPYFLPKL